MCFSLDPGNHKRLLFCPQLVFGFEELHSYQSLVRGVNQDSGGSFIESLGGQPNRSRLFCTVAASGIFDPVPGAPSVVAMLDVVTSKDPTSGQVIAVEALEATGVVLEDVWNQSPLR